MTTSVPVLAGHPAVLPRGVDRVRPARGAVRVGERDVHRVLVVEGLDPSGGPVHQLVGDDQGAGTVGGGERPDRARRQDAAHAERAQRPEIGAVRDHVRREPVVLAVPGQERHPAARHVADQHRLARLAERRLDRHLFGVGEELVEAGTADDPDVRDRIGLLGDCPAMPPSHRVRRPSPPEDFEDDEEEADEDDDDEAPLLSPDEDDEDLSPLPDLSPSTCRRRPRRTRTSQPRTLKPTPKSTRAPKP